MAVSVNLCDIAHNTSDLHAAATHLFQVRSNAIGMVPFRTALRQLWSQTPLYSLSSQNATEK